MMYKGVQISSNFDVSDRLTVSAGTQATNVINGVTLEKPVTVAAGEWLRPDARQLDVLLKQKNTRHQLNQVSVLKLDAATVAALKQLQFENCRSTDDFFSVLKSPAWDAARGRMQAFASKYKAADDTPAEIGPTFKAGGLQGTTVNQQTGKFTGLHIDSWEMYNSLCERKTARNRICFNIGLFPRYFCFVNLDVQQLYQRMTQSEPEAYQGLCGNYTPFVWKFFEENRAYPVTRIRVDPYEAYIAPTENILHDGSTEDNPFIDIFYTLRSYYQISSAKNRH